MKKFEQGDKMVITNEIEKVVKGLDLVEQTAEIEDEHGGGSLDNVFVYDTDIEPMKKTLKAALQQLENGEIQIKKESDEQ